MKAMIDTCVIMDFLQNREPLYRDSYIVLRFVATE